MREAIDNAANPAPTGREVADDPLGSADPPDPAESRPSLIWRKEGLNGGFRFHLDAEGVGLHAWDFSPYHIEMRLDQKELEQLAASLSRIVAQIRTEPVR